MEGDAVAFCPGHISGWFRPEFSQTDNAPGSVGGGIVIDRGVLSSATPSKEIRVTCIYTSRDGSVRKRIEGSPPVEHALKTAGISAEIVTETDLPPESGFGLSCAAIISSLAAGADASGIRISREQIFKTAYMTEIYFKAGLGDVPAVSGGGYVCRRESGLGGHIIRGYDMDKPVFVLNFGPLPTSEVLGEQITLERIESAYTRKCPETPEEFFKISRDFSERSGLITTEVREVLSVCDRERIPASMTMLGNGVFAYGDEAFTILNEFGTPEEMHVSKKGFTRGDKR
ncbi:MAG: GHMP kinase [Methanomicrobiaceae archaeon]|nr:GHMP kinase [Methanomicrobiaceae archaeon]